MNYILEQGIAYGLTRRYTHDEVIILVRKLVVNNKLTDYTGYSIDCLLTGNLVYISYSNSLYGCTNTDAKKFLKYPIKYLDKATEIKYNLTKKEH